MKVDTDKRSRDVEPAPEAERDARRAFRSITRAETKAAKALATIERRRSYVLAGFKSVHAWAKKIGYGPQQTRRLLELGRTLIDEPDLEEKVAKGEVPAETAAQVGRVLRDPKVGLDAQQKAEWKDKAGNEDPDKLRNDTEQAIEDAHQGAPTFLMRFRVTKKTRDDFRRVRRLMARGQKVVPTDGEVFGRMVQDYLVRHDPSEMPLPKRPRRRSSKRSRAVPKRVQAIVRRRSGGECEICGTRRACEFIHIVPFSEGGSNEADNIADGCRDCHVLYDAGVFRLSHFDELGRPRFVFDHDQFDSFQARNRGGGDDRERADPDRDGASWVRERPTTTSAYRCSRRRKRPPMTTGPPSGRGG